MTCKPLVAIFLLLLLGCEQAPPDYLEPPATTASAAMPIPEVAADVADAASPRSIPTDALRVDPLPHCGGRQVTTVRWADAAVATGAIRIWVDGTPPGLFAESAEAGSKSTGAWASPGMAFLVTDTDGRLLAKLTVISEGACG